MRSPRWLKFTAGMLVFFFVLNDMGQAAPALDLSAAFRTEIPRVSHIEIPPEMATLEDWYESPRVGDTRLMLHIQDAHAQPEAQARTRDLIQYLNKQYGFQTVFVEGAAEQLDAKWLNPFKEPEQNKKWAEEKTASGEMSGVDLALLDGVAGLRALPIETIEGYRSGYQKLRAVYSAEPEVKSFLDFFDSKLDLVASKVLDEKTRAILSEWKKFESGHREFLPFVGKLAELAKSDLNLELDKIYAQIEWPQLARLLVLQGIERNLAAQGVKVKGQSHGSNSDNLREQAKTEQKQLTDLLKSKNADAGLLSALERFDEKNLNLNRITVGDGRQFSSPRALVEQLVEETRHLKIDLREYPAFLKYAGYLILRGELEPSSLFKEIEKLFNRLLDGTADKTSADQPAKIIEIYRDSFLLKKLLNLELSRDEWRKAISRRDFISPLNLLKSLKLLSGQSLEVQGQSHNPKTTNFAGDKTEPKALSSLSVVFDQAFAFYDASIAREEIFFEKISGALAKNDKAILITGGFHTEGMNEFFREKEISYGTLTPRITNLASSSLYRNAMMRAGAVETASQPSVPLAQAPDVTAAMYGVRSGDAGVASDLQRALLLLENYVEIGDDSIDTQIGVVSLGLRNLSGDQAAEARWSRASSLERAVAVRLEGTLPLSGNEANRYLRWMDVAASDLKFALKHPKKAQLASKLESLKGEIERRTARSELRTVEIDGASLDWEIIENLLLGDTAKFDAAFNSKSGEEIYLKIKPSNSKQKQDLADAGFEPEDPNWVKSLVDDAQLLTYVVGAQPKIRAYLIQDKSINTTGLNQIEFDAGGIVRPKGDKGISASRLNEAGQLITFVPQVFVLAKNEILPERFKTRADKQTFEAAAREAERKLAGELEIQAKAEKDRLELQAAWDELNQRRVELEALLEQLKKNLSVILPQNISLIEDLLELDRLRSGVDVLDFVSELRAFEQSVRKLEKLIKQSPDEIKKKDSLLSRVMRLRSDWTEQKNDALKKVDAQKEAVQARLAAQQAAIAAQREKVRSFFDSFSPRHWTEWEKKVYPAGIAAMLFLGFMTVFYPYTLLRWLGFSGNEELPATVVSSAARSLGQLERDLSSWESAYKIDNYLRELIAQQGEDPRQGFKLVMGRSVPQTDHVETEQAFVVLNSPKNPQAMKPIPFNMINFVLNDGKKIKMAEADLPLVFPVITPYFDLSGWSEASPVSRAALAAYVLRAYFRNEFSADNRFKALVETYWQLVSQVSAPSAALNSQGAWRPSFSEVQEIRVELPSHWVAEDIELVAELTDSQGKSIPLDFLTKGFSARPESPQSNRLVIWIPAGRVPLLIFNARQAGQTGNLGQLKLIPRKANLRRSDFSASTMVIAKNGTAMHIVPTAQRPQMDLLMASPIWNALSDRLQTIGIPGSEPYRLLSIQEIVSLKSLGRSPYENLVMLWAADAQGTSYLISMIMNARDLNHPVVQPGVIVSGGLKNNPNQDSPTPPQMKFIEAEGKLIISSPEWLPEGDRSVDLRKVLSEQSGGSDVSRETLYKLKFMQNHRIYPGKRMEPGINPSNPASLVIFGSFKQEMERALKRQYGYAAGFELNLIGVEQIQLLNDDGTPKPGTYFIATQSDGSAFIFGRETAVQGSAMQPLYGLNIRSSNEKVFIGINGLEIVRNGKPAEKISWEAMRFWLDEQIKNSGNNKKSASPARSEARAVSLLRGSLMAAALGVSFIAGSLMAQDFRPATRVVTEQVWEANRQIVFGMGQWKVLAGDYQSTDAQKMLYEGKALSEIKIVFDTRRGHAPQAISINANGAIRGHAVQKGRDDGLASTFYMMRYHDEKGQMHDNALISKIYEIKNENGKLILDVAMVDRNVNGYVGWGVLRSKIIIYPPDRVDGTLRMDIDRGAIKGLKISDEKTRLFEGAFTDFVSTNQSGKDEKFGNKEYWDAEAAVFYDAQGSVILEKKLKQVLAQVPADSGFRLMTAEGTDWMPKKVGGVAAFAVQSQSHSPAHQSKSMPIPPTILVVEQRGLNHASGAVTYQIGKTNSDWDNVNVALQPENIQESIAEPSTVTVYFMPGASREAIDRIPQLIRETRAGRSEARDQVRVIKKLYGKTVDRLLKVAGQNGIVPAERVEEIRAWLKDDHFFRLLNSESNPAFVHRGRFRSDDPDDQPHIAFGLVGAELYEHQPELFGMHLAHEIAHAIHYKIGLESLLDHDAHGWAEAFACALAYALYPDVARKEMAHLKRSAGSVALYGEFLRDEEAMVALGRELDVELNLAREAASEDDLTALGLDQEQIARLRDGVPSRMNDQQRSEYSELLDELRALPFSVVADDSDKPFFDQLSIAEKIYFEHYLKWLVIRYAEKPDDRTAILESIPLLVQNSEEFHVHAAGYFTLLEWLKANHNYQGGKVLAGQWVKFAQRLARKLKSDFWSDRTELLGQTASRGDPDLLSLADPLRENMPRKLSWNNRFAEWSGARLFQFTSRLWRMTLKRPDFSLLSRETLMEPSEAEADSHEEVQSRRSQLLRIYHETAPALFNISEQLMIENLTSQFWPFDQDLEGGTLTALWEQAADFMRDFSHENFDYLEVELEDAEPSAVPMMRVLKKSRTGEEGEQVVLELLGVQLVSKVVSRSPWAPASLHLQVEYEDGLGKWYQVYEISDTDRPLMTELQVRPWEWTWYRVLDRVNKTLRILLMLAVSIVGAVKIADWILDWRDASKSVPKAIPVYEAKPVTDEGAVSRSEIRLAPEKRKELVDAALPVFDFLSAGQSYHLNPQTWSEENYLESSFEWADLARLRDEDLPDAVIFFGSHDDQVVKEAIPLLKELLRRKTDIQVVTTGKWSETHVKQAGNFQRKDAEGRSVRIAEADHFADLIESAIPALKGKVIRENQSTNTGENIKRSRADLESVGLNSKKIKLAAAAQSAHQRRVGLSILKQWFSDTELDQEDYDVSIISATPRKLDAAQLQTVSDDELILKSEIALGELKRLRDYATDAKRFIVPVDIPIAVVDAESKLSMILSLAGALGSRSALPPPAGIQMPPAIRPASPRQESLSNLIPRVELIPIVNDEQKPIIIPGFSGARLAKPRSIQNGLTPSELIEDQSLSFEIETPAGKAIVMGVFDGHGPKTEDGFSKGGREEAITARDEVEAYLRHHLSVMPANLTDTEGNLQTWTAEKLSEAVQTAGQLIQSLESGTTAVVTVVYPDQMKAVTASLGDSLGMVGNKAGGGFDVTTQQNISSLWRLSPLYFLKLIWNGNIWASAKEMAKTQLLKEKPSLLEIFRFLPMVGDRLTGGLGDHAGAIIFTEPAIVYSNLAQDSWIVLASDGLFSHREKPSLLNKIWGRHVVEAHNSALAILADPKLNERVHTDDRTALVLDMKKYLAGRSEMRETLKEFLKTLYPGGVAQYSQAEDVPDVFVLMGNPDVQTFVEFAAKWKKYQKLKSDSVIVITGGIGRGTLPLLESAAFYYQKTRPDLTRDFFKWYQELRKHLLNPTVNAKPPISEAMIINRVLEAEGVHEVLRRQGRDLSKSIFIEDQSKTTKENFEKIAVMFADPERGFAKQNLNIQLVTAPWLLRRAHITAVNIWKNPNWSIKSPAIYEPNLDEWDDDRLVSVAGYALGYPQSLKDKFQELSTNSEMKGVGDQTEVWNGHKTVALPLKYEKSPDDEQRLKLAQGVFAAWLSEAGQQIEYDEAENRMRFPGLMTSFGTEAINILQKLQYQSFAAEMAARGILIRNALTDMRGPEETINYVQFRDLEPAFGGASTKYFLRDLKTGKIIYAVNLWALRGKEQALPSITLQFIYEGKTIGYGFISPVPRRRTKDPKQVHLRFQIFNDFRGSGHASKLMLIMERALSRLGFEQIVMMVDSQRESEMTESFRAPFIKLGFHWSEKNKMLTYNLLARSESRDLGINETAIVGFAQALADLKDPNDLRAIAALVRNSQVELEAAIESADWHLVSDALQAVAVPDLDPDLARLWPFTDDLRYRNLVEVLIDLIRHEHQASFRTIFHWIEEDQLAFAELVLNGLIVVATVRRVFAESHPKSFTRAVLSVTPLPKNLSPLAAAATLAQQLLSGQEGESADAAKRAVEDFLTRVTPTDGDGQGRSEMRLDFADADLSKFREAWNSLNQNLSGTSFIKSIEKSSHHLNRTDKGLRESAILKFTTSEGKEFLMQMTEHENGEIFVAFPSEPNQHALMEASQVWKEWYRVQLIPYLRERGFTKMYRLKESIKPVGEDAFGFKDMGVMNAAYLRRFEIDFLSPLEALDARYAKLNNDFMTLAAPAGMPVLDQAQQVAIAKNYEKADGQIKLDGKGFPISREADMRPIVIKMGGDNLLARRLEAITREMMGLLPKDQIVAPVNRETYHITLLSNYGYPPDQLESERSLRGAEVSALTPGQVQAIQRVAGVQLQKVQPYELKLVGIRISPRDGSLIAVFRDEGQTFQIRESLQRSVFEAVPTDAKPTYPDLIHVSLLRVFNDFSSETLTKLQGFVQKYADMSSEKLVLPVEQTVMLHETRWHHQEIEAGSEVNMPLSRSEMRDELTIENVVEFISTHFGVDAKNVEVLKGGFMGPRIGYQQFLLYDQSGKKFVLKFYGLNRPRAVLTAELVNNLGKKGLPVPQLSRLTTSSDADNPFLAEALISNGRKGYYGLETFIEHGQALDTKAMTSAHFEELGRIAARIQSARPGWAPEQAVYKSRREVYFDEVEPKISTLNGQIDSLIARDSGNPVVAYLKEHRDEFMALIQQHAQMFQVHFPTSVLPRGFIHNDLIPSNLQWRAGKIVGILDFNLAQADDRVVEFNNIIFGGDGYTLPEFEQEKLDAAIRGYDAVANQELSADEKLAIRELLRLRLLEELLLPLFPSRSQDPLIFQPQTKPTDFWFSALKTLQSWDQKDVFRSEARLESSAQSLSEKNEPKRRDGEVPTMIPSDISVNSATFDAAYETLMMRLNEIKTANEAATVIAHVFVDPDLNDEQKMSVLMSLAQFLPMDQVAVMRDRVKREHPEVWKQFSRGAVKPRLTREISPADLADSEVVTALAESMVRAWIFNPDLQFDWVVRGEAQDLLAAKLSSAVQRLALGSNVKAKYSLRFSPKGIDGITLEEGRVYSAPQMSSAVPRNATFVQETWQTGELDASQRIRAHRTAILLLSQLAQSGAMTALLNGYFSFKNSQHFELSAQGLKLALEEIVTRIEAATAFAAAA